MVDYFSDNNSGRPIQPILYCLVILLFLSILMLFSAFSEAGEAGTSARPTILSGSEIDYPPFCAIDEEGKPIGFSVELFRAALAAMGRDVFFRTGPWAEVRGWLERGEIQALPLVGRTPERDPLFDFTFPYMSLHGAIVVRRNNKDIDGLKDLAGKQVAVMKSDNIEEFLRREDRGIKIHAAATFEDALRELSQGQHDAVVIQRLVAIRLIQKTGLDNLRIINKPLEGFRQDFCFAVKEGDRDTLALLNEGLALVMADGTYRHLHAKWFAALELPPHHRIVIGGDHNYPPYEYLDENGRPSGFTVELSRAIAKEMGLDITFRLGPWSEILQELENGKIDVIQGIFYSPKRDLKFDFTQPHLVNHYISVIRKGNGKPPDSLDELEGKSIVIQRGDVLYDFLVENGLGQQVTLVETQEDVLRATASGKFDCGIAVRISSLYLIEKHKIADIELGQQPIHTAEYCYAVAHNRRALLAQFSEGLKVLDENGGYRRIYDKYMSVYDASSTNLRRILRHIAMGAVPLIVIILLVLLWSWSLRKQVASRTEELRSSEEFQKAMIACSPVALYSINLDGNVTTWNPTAEKMFGWTEEEVNGKPLPFVPEDKQKEFLGLRQRVVAEKGFSNLEVIRQKRDGSLFLASLSAAPIHDAKGNLFGIMGAIEDITDKKQAEEKLLESEERHRLLAENTLDVIWTMNLDLEFSYVNPAIFHMTGHTPEEWIGSRLPDHCDENNFAKMAEIIAGEFGKGPGSKGVIFEAEMLKKNGTPITVEIHGKVIYDNNGQAISLQGVTRDISERVQAQKKLIRSETLLNAAQRISKIGGWEWDIEREEMFWTDETYHIHDLDPTDVPIGSSEHIERSLECYADEYRPQIISAFQNCVATGEPYELECRFTTTKGRPLWIKTAGQAVIENDRVVKIFGNMQDITKQKHAEENQGYLDQLLREIGSIAKIGAWEFDPDTGQGTWTEEVARIHELDPSEETNMDRGLNFFQRDSREKIEKAIQEAVEHARPYDLELELVTFKGTNKWIRTIGHPKVENGKVVQVRGSFQDITEMKLTQAALERYNFMLSRLLEVARELTAVLNFESAVQIIQQAALDLSGADGVTTIVREGDYCYFLDEAGMDQQWKGKRFHIDECISGWVMLNKQSVAIEDIYSDPRISKEAYRSTFVRSLAMSPIRSDDPVGAIGVYWAERHEVTSQERALLTALGNMLATLWDALQTREALRSSENTLSTMFGHMQDGILMMDVETRKFVITNEAICRELGYTREELLSLGLYDIHPAEDLPHVEAEFERQLSGEITIAADIPMKRKDGSVYFADINAASLELDGRPRVLGIFRNITKRKQDEERIEHLNRVLKAIRDVNQLIIHERNPAKLIQEACRLLVHNRGYVSALIILTDESDRPVSCAQAGLDAVRDQIVADCERGELPPCHDYVRSMKTAVLIEDRDKYCSGCRISVYYPKSFSLCVRLAHGEIAFGYLFVALEPGLAVNEEEIGLFTDMANDLAFALYGIKINEGRLTAERERKSLQSQLFQAQKMESVGRLAGGVAHDFNNMLTVIIGNTEMALSNLEPGNPTYSHLKEILNAGKRSSDLTRQLLAFARKQTIKPIALDLNETVESMLKMLRRLLGEDIDILWKPDANLWMVKMDPAQIDQIMANLCVNARDAMSGQGKVTIETGNITFDDDYCDKHEGFIPGDFVMLAVSDNGLGMDKEIIDKVFEPFFTTKKEGQGTGLGLSMIYGIVKQNDGFINVYSETGQGTTFKIYLPQYQGKVSAAQTSTLSDAIKGRGETVLLTEDDPNILRIGKGMLERLGYNVLAADTPSEALRLTREHVSEIKLLITDVIMPEMNGKDLAERIMEIIPDIRCLYMSGYTANVIAHHGVIDEDVQFIQKPFSYVSLANKVREVLDS